MKRLTLKKLKIFFTACFAFLAIGASALLASPVSQRAFAAEEESETLSSAQYQTDGASVRVFNNKKQEDGTRKLIETEKKGIRFHVETGADYQIAENTPLLDVSATNESNGSFVVADGYKTYTLILPTRLLSGDLTPTTDKVMAIETTKYWFADKDGNWESVAYIYNVPESMYTDNFSYRGIIVKVEGETETVVAETAVTERSLAYVAKRAYQDTIDENSTYWGSQDLDDQAAPLIKQFVPTYTITYQDAKGNNLLGEGQTEEVLWGDAPASVPTDVVVDAWYDTTASEEIDVTQTMSFTKNRILTLTTTDSNSFLLTGVAAQSSYTVGETTYKGVKIYATLPTTGSAALAYNTELDINAVNVEYDGTGTFNGLKGVWTMQDGNQMRLFFAFKDGTKLASGDKLIVKGDSVFYANGIMYKLSQDYTIDYDGDDYGMFLGYLYNSDVKEIKNYSETRKDSNGEEYTAKVIRIEFYKDVLINSNYTFVHDSLPEGYTSPVYVDCGQASGTRTFVTGGYYYWNDGNHKILELNAYGDHNQDELHALAGTKVLQNGGYYIFKEAMYAYYNGTNWVNGKSIGTFGISEFATTGKNTTDGTNEVRINTNTRWWNDAVQLTVENMSPTATNAVYYTSASGNVTPITSFIFHGQEYTGADGSTAVHQIFGIRETLGQQVGDTITIVDGTRFWNGSEYYTFDDTKNLVLYYNGSYWVTDSDGSVTGTLDSTSFSLRVEDYTGDGDGVKTRFYLNEEIFSSYQTITVENGSIKISGKDYSSLGFALNYYTDGNKIIELYNPEAQAGINAFSDTIVFEEGTRLWKDNVCYEFTETVTFVYLGTTLSSTNGTNIKAAWVQRNNVNVAAADITRIYNEGTEIRIQFKAGIIKDIYYGALIMDASKGLPIVNGVTVSAESGWTYDMTNNLFGIRGSRDSVNQGDTLIIPAGSTWWTTQGSITFTQDICAVYPANPDDSSWTYGVKTNTDLGAISADSITKVYNFEENQVRVKIPLEISDSYYGLLSLDGEVYVTKADGTKISPTLVSWYGGQTPQYPDQDHSLIGFGNTGIAGTENGDQFTIKANTKLSFMDGSGYRTFAEDVVYTYVDGSWQAGDLTATASYSVANATVSGETNVIVGKEYTFTVTPESGYVVSSVAFNGTPLAITENNSYTFTAVSGENNIVVTTNKTYTVTVSASNATVSGVSNNQSITHGQTYDFTVSTETGYAITSVTINGTEQGTSGSYSFTVSGETSIVVTTEPKTYKATVSASNATVSVSNNQSITHGQTYSFTVNAASGYAITSVTIDGTEQGTGGSYSFTVNAADVSIVVTTKKLHAVTWSNPTGATISVTANGSSIESGATVLDGTSISVTATASEGYRLDTVTIGGTAQSGVSTSHAGSSTFNYTVNAATTISATTVRMYTVSWTEGSGTTITCNTSGLTNGGWVDNGTTVSFTINLESNYKDLKVNGSTFAGGTYTATVNGANVSVEATATYDITDITCLVEGTMIMMADGSQKAVDNIVAGDKVMVFNHETGKYEAGTIWFNDHADAPAKLRNVINLEFANGASARIAYEHGYFDLDLMKYVFIREDNMHEFIGHTFVATSYNGTEVIQSETTLVNAYITQEVVKVYGPITEYHFNLISDDMLSMPSFNFEATGMVNIFEYDENLQYNAEKMQADIETYGVFTYEEFSEYMSYEDYCKAPIPYFKVAIGKGNLTWEQIELTLQYLAVNEF